MPDTPDDGDPLLLLLLADLMIESRVEEAAHRLGLRTWIVPTLADLPAALVQGAASAAVFDLASPSFPLEETMQVLRGGGSARGAPTVLAFYPHVHRELGEAGQRAGCTIVVPRSRFVNGLPALLSQLVMTRKAAATEGGV